MNGSGINTGNATLAILAGGEGARMGTPKGLLRVGGTPILEFLLSRFNWPGPTLLVTAPGRAHPPGWEHFDREAIDPVTGEGPLRGVLTALEHATTPFLVVATVDMPAVRPEQLTWLLGTLCARPDLLGVMVRRKDDATGEDRVEPFPSTFNRKAAAAVVERHLGAGRRSVHSLAREPGFATVAAPPEWPIDTWTNLNHPADLEAFLESRES